MYLQSRGLEVEIETEAEAGVMLGDGSHWWGTRVKRWTKFLLIDVHPFEYGKIEAAVEAHIGRPR